MYKHLSISCLTMQSGNHDRCCTPPVGCQRLWSCGLCRLLCCQEKPEHTHIRVWCHLANSLYVYHGSLLLQQGTKQNKAVHGGAGSSRGLLPINSSQRSMALREPSGCHVQVSQDRSLGCAGIRAQHMAGHRHPAVRGSQQGHQPHACQRQRRAATSSQAPSVAQPLRILLRRASQHHRTAFRCLASGVS